MIVVDASAIVDILLAKPVRERLLRRVFVENEGVHAPQLLDLEVVHSLRRFWLNGEVSEARAFAGLTMLGSMPIRRHSHDDFVLRVWELRRNVTAYDAIYVALAELLDVPLITRDARLARSSGHAATIEFIE